MSTKWSRFESFAIRPSVLMHRESLGKFEIKVAAPLGSKAAGRPSPPMRVGFIGLDHTGKVMASRLVKAGHHLTVYDPTREMPALQSACVNVANSIEDACHEADAVFTMLSDDNAASAVILDPGGVVESLPRNSIHIGSSTVSVECSDQIVEAHWNAGKQYISAPILVRCDGTSDEQMLVIAGGPEGTIIQMETLLSPIGEIAQLGGWPSDANIIQLGANYMGATLLQFLDRHPELCTQQHRMQLARPGSPLARFLSTETKGVPQ